MTSKEIAEKLKEEKRVYNKKLMVYPEWLTHKMLVKMEDEGYAYHVFYKNLYGHTDWFIL